MSVHYKIFYSESKSGAVYVISYLYYIQVNPVSGEKQVHRPLDIEHVKRQNKDAPTIIGTSPEV
jgi:hypothetical protein